MPTNNVITTSFVISFGGDSSSGILKAEVDDRPAGLNAGKTSFLPGDNVGFLVFKSTNVEIIKELTSQGIITKGANSFKTVEQVLTFANEPTQTLSYPIDTTSGFTSGPTWFGNDLGGLVMTDDSTVHCPAIVGGTDPALAKVGVCTVTYQSPCIEYMLSGTLLPFASYSILVYLMGLRT